jgi:hypothetical protein
MFIQDEAQAQDINITSSITVEVRENRQAAVTVPPELRLTAQLLSLITQALEAQGLTLQHMNISEQHRGELENLPNVVLESENNQ